MRRALRALATVMIVAGALLVADAAATFAWQEPITALLTRLQQNGLSNDLEALERRARLLPRSGRSSAEHGPQANCVLARSLKRRSGSGEAVGRLRIPRMDLNLVVVDEAARRICARAPASTTRPSSPVYRERRRSRGIAPRTARPSGASTSCAPAIGSSSRCPIDIHLRGRGSPHREAHRSGRDPACALRKACPLGLPSALQRVQALGGVRPSSEVDLGQHLSDPLDASDNRSG